MPRVKKGKTALKRRRSVLSEAKGYRFGRSKKEKEAKQAVTRALSQSRAHRRRKKGDFRRLWQVKINAAVREHGMSYSKFIDALKKSEIMLDRKVLAEIAEHAPDTFSRIVKEVA